MNTIIAEGARVIHALPGRIRIRLPGWSGWGHRRIEERLRRLRGVDDARANALTGTVLIRFDPGAITQTALLAALGALQPDPPGGRVDSPERQGRVGCHRAHRQLPRLPGGAAFGTGLAALCRLADLSAAVAGPRDWATVGDVLHLVQGLPWMRGALDRLLGPGLSRVIWHVIQALASAWAGRPLGASVAALEALLQIGDLLAPFLRIGQPRPEALAAA